MLPCNMVFQWDDLFGIVIEYSKGEKNAVLEFLRGFDIKEDDKNQEIKNEC